MPRITIMFLALLVDGGSGWVSHYIDEEFYRWAYGAARWEIARNNGERRLECCECLSGYIFGGRIKFEHEGRVFRTHICLITFVSNGNWFVLEALGEESNLKLMKKLEQVELVLQVTMEDGWMDVPTQSNLAWLKCTESNPCMWSSCKWSVEFVYRLHSFCENSVHTFTANHFTEFPYKLAGEGDLQNPP